MAEHTEANPEVKDTSAVVEGEHDATGLTKEEKKYGVSKKELRGKAPGSQVVDSEPSTSFEERTIGNKMPWEDYNNDRVQAEAKANEEARDNAPTVSDEDNPVKTGARQAQDSMDQTDAEKSTGGHPGAAVKASEQKASK